jgi:hypothetical protein
MDSSLGARDSAEIAVVEEIANLSLPFIPSGVLDDAQR